MKQESERSFSLREKGAGTRDDLHDRICYIFLITGTILSTIALILGISFGAPFIMNIPHGVVMLVCIFLPMIFKGDLTVPSLAALYGVSYFYLPFIYFTNGGINGSGPFFFIMVLVYFAFFRRGKQLFLTMGPLVLFYLGIIWFSFRFPASVIPYPDLFSQYVDMSVCLVSVAVVMSLVAGNTYRGYEKERQNTMEMAETLAAKNRKLESLSIRDQLTGVFNRVFFLGQMEEELINAGEKGRTFYTMMIDIDHFKKVNDSYGHLIGDEILKLIGAILRESIRDHDVAARYGGEEFVVLISHSSPESGPLIAERIRSSIEKLQYRDIDHVTVSIGVAANNGFDKAKDILRCADEMMYRAKKDGRNRVVTFSV